MITIYLTASNECPKIVIKIVVDEKLFWICYELTTSFILDKLKVLEICLFNLAIVTLRDIHKEEEVWSNSKLYVVQPRQQRTAFKNAPDYCFFRLNVLILYFIVLKRKHQNTYIVENIKRQNLLAPFGRGGGCYNSSNYVHLLCLQISCIEDFYKITS